MSLRPSDDFPKPLLSKYLLGFGYSELTGTEIRFGARIEAARLLPFLKQTLESAVSLGLSARLQVVEQ